MTPLFPAPQNVRQLVLAFAAYDKSAGLNSVLNRMSFEGVTRRQVYFSAVGRGPENAKMAVSGPNYNPRAHLSQTLQADEFQQRIRELILTAFPEKRRLIFVHIAKCAGSDLMQTMQRQYPYVHHHMALANITSRAELFELLREFAIAVPLSDSIAVAGHVPLRWYLERKLVRFEDDLFSTIREPRELLYSFISFILTRVVTFQGKKRSDTKAWLSHLGMTDIEPNPSPGYLVELGGRLLRARPVTPPNLLCANLGRGDAASAIESIVTTDIELTDMKRYSAWRLQKFGYEPRSRVNPSQAYFSPENATPADRALIEEMVGEDTVLYEKLRKHLDAGDGLSIRGHVLG